MFWANERRSTEEVLSGSRPKDVAEYVSIASGLQCVLATRPHATSSCEWSLVSTELKQEFAGAFASSL